MIVDAPALVLAAVGLLVVGGMLFEWLQKRFGVPEALLLIALGGGLSAGGALDIRALGALGPLFTTSALVFILFESGLDIRVGELRRAAGPLLKLTVLSFVLCVVSVALVAMIAAGLPPLVAVLAGTILGGTSSAVVVPMTRALGLGSDARVVLTLESALNDVLCVVCALALIAFLTSTGGATPTAPSLLRVIPELLGAIVIGALAGGAVAWALRLVRSRRGTFAFLAASVVLTWASAEAATGQGGLATLAMGFVLGNQDALFRRFGPAPAHLEADERMFVADAAFVFKVLFFVYLGASLRLEHGAGVLLGVLAGVALALARPLAIRLSLPTRDFPCGDRIAAALLAPKGLAAAVLASVPAQRGVPYGQVIEAFAVGCIISTIVASTTLPFLARRYGAPRSLLRALGEEGAPPHSAPSPSPGE